MLCLSKTIKSGVFVFCDYLEEEKKKKEMRHQ